MSGTHSCDLCQRIVTYKSEITDQKKPVLKHFHDEAGNTICLDCIFKFFQQYGKKLHPEFYYEGSLNAGWMPLDLWIIKMISEGEKFEF